jgi:hypothetical protein
MLKGLSMWKKQDLFRAKASEYEQQTKPPRRQERQEPAKFYCICMG